MPDTVDFELPRRLSEEVLRQYADVLRVGRMRVGCETVSWDTQLSSADQLQSFCQAIAVALQRVPELSGLGDDVLAQASYWLCKVFSINYALVEVLAFVRGRVGPMCSIKTCGDDGASLVDYSVEVVPETGSLRAAMTWRLAGNVVQCVPKRVRPKVRGTLSCLETEFPVPPEFGYTPVYRVHSRFQGDSKSSIRLLPRLGCFGARTQRKKQRSPASIVLDAPLCGDCPFIAAGKLSSPGSTATGSTCDGGDGEGGGGEGASERGCGSFPLSEDKLSLVEDDMNLVPSPVRTMNARTVRPLSRGKSNTRRAPGPPLIDRV